MLLLSEQNVKDCLCMSQCLTVNRQALTAVATGNAKVPTRLALPYLSSHHHVEEGGGGGASDWTLFKPAAHVTSSQFTRNMGLKVVSVRANNPAHGLPLVPATILSLHPETGQVQAVVAATYLTAARTAAGSALSTLLVRNENVRAIHHVTVFGAGLQAKLHLHALYTAMGEQPIPHVTIINRTVENAQRFQMEIPAEWVETPIRVVGLDDFVAVRETLAETDVIFTTTNTMTPLFDGSCLRPGTHIAGVGSYTPDMQEVSARTVDQCRVFIDTPEARTVGDLKHLTDAHPVTLLGTALSSSPDQWFAQSYDPQMFPCTFFKSVGTAIQDVLTADLVVQLARERGIGTEVDMS